MEILAILETLEDIVEKSIGLPFSGKCITDREEILEIVKEIRLKLPDDIKQAKWIKEERQRIIEESQEKAENIINNADDRISALIDKHEITKKAYEQANEIIKNAQKSAREIKLGAKDYANNVLSKVERTMEETIDVIQTNKEELK